MFKRLSGFRMRVLIFAAGIFAMASTLLVVDDLSDWSPYYPSERVISFEQYLAGERVSAEQRVRVINLCGSYAYLSDGYYCSLLAEARNHHVIPSVKVINDLGKNALYRLQLEDFSQSLARAFKHQNLNGEFVLHSYFGITPDTTFGARGYCSKRFPVRYWKSDCAQQHWEITDLKAVSPRGDGCSMQTLRRALDKYGKKSGARARHAKLRRMAILIDPAKALPPNNRRA